MGLVKSRLKGATRGLTAYVPINSNHLHVAPFKDTFTVELKKSACGYDVCSGNTAVSVLSHTELCAECLRCCLGVMAAWLRRAAMLCPSPVPGGSEECGGGAMW